MSFLTSLGLSVWWLEACCLLPQHVHGGIHALAVDHNELESILFKAWPCAQRCMFGMHMLDSNH